MWVTVALKANNGLTRLKRFVSRFFQPNCVISLFFYLYLIFHACVQRFDGMDEKFLGRKLNKAYTCGKRSSLKMWCRFNEAIKHHFRETSSMTSCSSATPLLPVSKSCLLLFAKHFQEALYKAFYHKNLKTNQKKIKLQHALLGHAWML